MPSRVLLVHLSLQPPGGANAVSAWTAQALQNAGYDITVLTWSPVDAEAINRFYGTSLRQDALRVIRPPGVVRLLRKLDPDPESLQTAAYLMRVCQRIRSRYDLVIGTSAEEWDLGGPALLYIHYVYLSRFWREYEDCGERPLLTKLRLLATGRTRPWMLLSNFSVQRFKQTASFIANSHWTAERVTEAYDAASTVLYPPVVSTAGLPWEQRENGFLASGRFNPDKRFEWMVRVLARVRAHVPSLRLHIVGTRESKPSCVAYYRELRELVDANRDWITLHEDLSREALTTLTGTVRYGIHAMIDEHFGIAPAEALMAGCIPFVHASGGQVEIVGADPRLCVTTEEDAAEKIRAVVADTALQTLLRDTLAPRRHLFTPERFMEGILEMASAWISRNRAPSDRQS